MLILSNVLVDALERLPHGLEGALQAGLVGAEVEVVGHHSLGVKLADEECQVVGHDLVHSYLGEALVAEHLLLSVIVLKDAQHADLSEQLVQRHEYLELAHHEVLVILSLELLQVLNADLVVKFVERHAVQAHNEAAVLLQVDLDRACVSAALSPHEAH